MAHVIADDDIVRTHAEATGNTRPPLIVVEPLLAFLDAHGLGAGEPTFTIVGDGHSNVTYLVTRGNARFVLRRPPRPPIPPSANDMLREARVLLALHGRARVPKVLAVCEDPAVLGAPFYVMEEVEGRVVAHELPPDLADPAQQRRLGEELIDALAELHAVDWRAAGLEGFGRPDGYLERQLRRWRTLWDHNRTREVPAVERVGEWLGRTMPSSPPATIVHGDYRPGNVMFAPDAPARLVAVFDWEMSTIGDPLADLGYLTALWTDPGDPSLGMFELAPVTRAGGFPTKAELLAAYEERSGHSTAEIRWYQALALWKVIVFMEGNYKRAASGMSDDPYLSAFGDGVVDLASRAEQLTRGRPR